MPKLPGVRVAFLLIALMVSTGVGVGAVAGEHPPALLLADVNTCKQGCYGDCRRADGQVALVCLNQCFTNCEAAEKKCTERYCTEWLSDGKCKLWDYREVPC